MQGNEGRTTKHVERGMPGVVWRGMPWADVVILRVGITTVLEWRSLTAAPRREMSSPTRARPLPESLDSGKWAVVRRRFGDALWALWPFRPLGAVGGPQRETAEVDADADAASPVSFCSRFHSRREHGREYLPYYGLTAPTLPYYYYFSCASLPLLSSLFLFLQDLTIPVIHSLHAQLRCLHSLSTRL